MVELSAFLVASNSFYAIVLQLEVPLFEKVVLLAENS